MHGGKRLNAGRKLKYGEKTVIVQVYCPISKVEELKGVIKNKLKEYEIKDTPKNNG